tara:strand:- start:17 stop:172 length:156 start_codon:yes stop_codon:yes gene_type:complete
MDIIFLFLASLTTDLATPCAENIIGRFIGASLTSSTKIAPIHANEFTTSLL